jgi:hypothetical protein
VTRIESLARSIAQGFWKAFYAIHSIVNQARLNVRATGESLRTWQTTSRNRLYEWMGKPLPVPLEVQREQLIEFYEQFEELSDMVCDAAHRGDGTPWQPKYERVRVWMMKTYPNMRLYLIAHLSCDSSDDALGMQIQGKPADAFEALFIAPTLNELLLLDQGDLIGRLDRTRSALYRYADHLRGLMIN